MAKRYFKKAKDYEGEIEILKQKNNKFAKKIRVLEADSYKMAVGKQKPESTDKDDELFQVIDNKVQDAVAHTQTWSSNQLKWHKLRMRVKKTKTFPFVGCSNIRMPTAEIKIRKVKAALVNTIFGIRPVVQAIPSPSGNLQTAQKIEKFLDHIINNVIGLMAKAIVVIDQELEKGFYLFKPFWRTEITTRTEEFSLKDLSMDEVVAFYDEMTTPKMIAMDLLDRFEVDKSSLVAEYNEKSITAAVKDILAGKDNIKIKIQDVLYNYPDVAVCDPERIFVPTDAGVDVQKLQFITHEFFMPFNQVKANVEYKQWSKSAVDEIGEYLGTTKAKDTIQGTTTETQKDLSEGIERINNPSNQVKIWEAYCWYDLNKDGVDEKCVVTCAPEFAKVLRAVALPFNNGKWPFVKLYYELKDDRWFAHRGIPEIIEDIIKEIDIQHMQKVDQQTIRNSPMFVYRAGMVNPNLVQFIPNQGIPVNGMNPLDDTIRLLDNTNPNAEYSYEREQMILETKVEELIGQVDFTLQSMINKREPRTLGEVQMQQQNMQSVFSLDAHMHTEAFSELFSMLWDLWCQYGDDEYEFAFFGQNGWEPIRLTREEVQGKYRIVVRGNDQNTNPQVKMQKAQQILMAVTNPIFIQTGVIQPPQIAAGLKRFFQELDIPNWEELLNLNPMPPPPPQQPPPPPEPPTDPMGQMQPKFDDLASGEQAQILAKLGIKPDMADRKFQRQKEVAELKIKAEALRAKERGGSKARA